MSETLTKADIIAAIQSENGYSLRKSADTVETLIEIIKRTLETGENVMISGFGKFQVKEKRERRGRNPATGDDMILPPRKIVTFMCSGKITGQGKWGIMGIVRRATTYRYHHNPSLKKALISV